MNREGKLYRSIRFGRGCAELINDSVILVTKSKKWSSGITDEQSNFIHTCLVLDCPLSPTDIGREVQLDEHKYSTKDCVYQSTWSEDYAYIEV